MPQEPGDSLEDTGQVLGDSLGVNYPLALDSREELPAEAKKAS